MARSRERIPLLQLSRRSVAIGQSGFAVMRRPVYRGMGGAVAVQTLRWPEFPAAVVRAVAPDGTR